VIFTNDHYFQLTVREFFLKKDGVPIHPPLIQFHRPLEWYMQALRTNGFVVTDIREPQPPPDTAMKGPAGALERERRVAFFLVAAALKER
jgi:hypothetical protein